MPDTFFCSKFYYGISIAAAVETELDVAVFLIAG